jgi:hypothetical protein
MHKLACDSLHSSCLVHAAVMKIILQQSMESFIKFEIFTTVKIKTGAVCNVIPSVPVTKVYSALYMLKIYEVLVT